METPPRLEPQEGAAVTDGKVHDALLALHQAALSEAALLGLRGGHGVAAA